MQYDLPTTVNIGGEDFSIRSDYRAILDIFKALNDVELSDRDRAEVVLGIFYPDYEQITDYNEALQKCFSFINMGQQDTSGKKQPNLVDWENDLPFIVAPINRVLGYEVRSVPYDREKNEGGLHWYTFLSAYYEIGDCVFAQIVGIRDKKLRHKKLDKSEQEFYKRHRDLVDIKTKYTEAEDALVSYWA